MRPAAESPVRKRTNGKKGHGVPNGTKNGANGAAPAVQGQVDLLELLHALQAMRAGDFSVRLQRDQDGMAGKIADTFNEIVTANQKMAHELERVGEVVGKEGRTKQRVRFGMPTGAWSEMEGSVNSLIDDLLWPTTERTRAVTGVR